MISSGLLARNYEVAGRVNRLGLVQQKHHFSRCKFFLTVFLQSDTVVTIYFSACSAQLLIEASIYFFGKPRDINSGWRRYVRVRR